MEIENLRKIKQKERIIFLEILPNPFPNSGWFKKEAKEMQDRGKVYASILTSSSQIKYEGWIDREKLEFPTKKDINIFNTNKGRNNGKNKNS